MRILLLVLACAACGVARRAPDAPAPSPGPAEPSVPAPRPSANDGPWSFAWQPGTRAYAIASDATIELRDDSLPAEQVRTTTFVRYTVAPASGPVAEVQGFVDSVIVEPLGRAGRVAGSRQRLLSDAISFSARLDGARRRVDFPPLASQCATPAERTAAGAALVTARDLLLPLPPTLAPRATWRDTVASTVCRGDLPVATTVVRTYTVEGASDFEGTPALRVRRAGELRLAGKKGGRRPSRLEGSGTATQLLYVSPEGELLGATGESSAELRLVAGEESGQVRQRVRTVVRRVGR